jgi:hypothetical protein
MGAGLRAQEQEVPINEGGVLLVHDHGPVTRASIPECDRMDLADLREARVEGGVEEAPRLIGVYAAFAPEDSVLLAGVTFGIRYPPTVSILSHGACGNNGFEIAPPDWPADRLGVAVVLPSLSAPVVPVYWFLILSSGPGWFEVTPHPVPRHGGSFGSGHAAPRITPISGYGKLGIGTPGRLPEPGTPTPRGICCIDGCYWLSPLECDWFTGLWLGSDTDCGSNPCDPEGLPGACCVGAQCTLETRRDCIVEGGRFFGEGTSCDGIDCVQEIDVGGSR